MKRLEGQGASKSLCRWLEEVTDTGEYTWSLTEVSQGLPREQKPTDIPAEIYLKGIKGCFSRKMTQPTGWPRCLYTKAHSMDNKPKEGLEATMMKLWPCCHYWSLVGQIVWLEYNYQWLWAVEEEIERRERWRGCSLCQEVYWVWRAASEEQVERL